VRFFCKSARARRLGVVCVVVVVVGGCGSGGSERSTADFGFVSPGGKTRLFYDPPATRGAIGAMEGESLTEPGIQVHLSDFAGKVVVLNVWGSWCAPCRAETTDLERVAVATAPLGVRFLGVNVRDESREAAVDFVGNYGVTYPSLYDPPGRSLLALKGFPRSVVPATVVLDRRHRVAAIFLEQVLDSDLRPVVERIAAEVVESP
jgi:thiol-disulfide isomerase/thioredoxin